MSTSSELREQVESALAMRFPAALFVRPPAPPELISCGIREVDTVLGGGLPLGAITELTGTLSSGRTSLALAALSEVTRYGESCAYVDVSDALDPTSAAAAGVDLGCLLWIRAGESQAGDHRAEVSGKESGVDVQVTSSQPQAEDDDRFASAAPRLGGRHPRIESNGPDQAVGKLFQRIPSEQPDFVPRCAEAKRRPSLQPVTIAPVPFVAQRPIRKIETSRVRREHTWTRLDQALRATDLLLSAGGFRAIVLDMGDIAPEQARRVPLATWYRFRLQAEKAHTLLLLITRVPCAHSCAAVSLRFQQSSADWQLTTPQSPRLLGGFCCRVYVERNRKVDPTQKKPTAFATASWNSHVALSR